MKQAAWLVAGALVIIGGFAAAQAPAIFGGHHDHSGSPPPAIVASGSVPSAGAALPDLPAATTGSAPTAADALTRLERLDWIHISERGEFNPENGVRRGTGTRDDPFIFEGFYAQGFAIEDVEAAYVIRDAYVSGTMKLDYTGAGSRVENSTIGFLLTDTNRAHKAPHTWLDVQNNVLGAARIRHAGGLFADNVVGTPGRLDPHGLALEVQGYNGLVLARNVVHGPVEFRLHGHHYATSFEHVWMQGHHHGDPTVRYHAVRVEQNEFYDASGHGVDISDRDHAQNHGTAASETDTRLDDRHSHHLHFVFQNNRIVGAGLQIDQPNAKDDKHLGGSATIDVLRNRISDPLEGVGIRVKRAEDSVVNVDGNVIENTGARVEGSVGVLIKEAHGGSVLVRAGSIDAFALGVKAYDWHDGGTWAIDRVAMSDVGREAWWDKSVESPPRVTPR